MDDCEHKRIRRMDWPDNGCAEVCVDCLLTRHHWEQGETEWQDHGYKTIADWYAEAESLERSMVDMMGVTDHELKTDKIVFGLSWDLLKPYEIRFDDRDFKLNDHVWLRETMFSGEEMKLENPLIYTHRSIRSKIISIIKDVYGLKEGWCVLGLKEISRTT